MINLLEYITGLTTPPGHPKESLTATQKLALLALTIEGRGEAVELRIEALRVTLSLGTERSVYRLIDSLEKWGLIALEKRRSPGGHPLPPLVLTAPKITRKPTDIHVSRQEKPTDMYVTKQEPTDIHVSKPQPTDMYVSRENLNNNNDLQEPTDIHVSRERGMGIALNTPPPLSYSLIKNKEKEGGVFNKEKGLTDIHVSRLSENLFVIKWLETFKIDLPEAAAALIAKKVSIMEAWEDTLDGWLANVRWHKDNVAGQVERYEKKVKRGEYTAAVEEQPKKQPKEKTPEQLAEDEIYKDIMYGKQPKK